MVARFQGLPDPRKRGDSLRDGSSEPIASLNELAVRPEGFVGDDPFDGGNLPFSARHRLADHITEIIHGVQAHASDSGHHGVDDARHAEIDDLETSAGSRRRAAIVGINQKLRSPRRDDHAIDVRQRPVEVQQGNDFSAGSSRCIRRVVRRTAGHEKACGSTLP